MVLPSLLVDLYQQYYNIPQLLHTVIPVTVNLAASDDTLPPSLLATQVYVLSSDDLTSGITSLLLLMPLTLLGNDPDPIFH